MSEGIDGQRDQIIHHLEVLNRGVERQMSVWHTFRNGVIYGVGFIIGSTLLTAALVSIGVQFFGDTFFGDVIFWIAGER